MANKVVLNYAGPVSEDNVARIKEALGGDAMFINVRSIFRNFENSADSLVAQTLSLVEDSNQLAEMFKVKDIFAVGNEVVVIMPRLMASAIVLNYEIIRRTKRIPKIAFFYKDSFDSDYKFLYIVDVEKEYKDIIPLLSKPEIVEELCMGCRTMLEENGLVEKKAAE